MARRSRRGRGAGIAPPSGGLMLNVAELVSDQSGQVRAVNVQVSEAAVTEALGVIDAMTPETQHARLTGLQWNSWLSELWGIATVVRDPTTYVHVPATGDPTIFYPARYVQGAARPVQSARAEQSSPPGVPIIGVDMLVMGTGAAWARSAGWDPSAEGLQPLEVERRTWALALYECVARMGERATATGNAPERDGGAWWIGAAVVAVGLLVFSIAYGTDAVVQVERQTAIDAQCITTAARLYEARLAEWRRTGNMPAASELETRCTAIRDTMANSGWTRLQNTASDVLREGTRAVSSGLKWGLAALVAYKLLQG